MTNEELDKASSIIKNGGVIAYPTESVFGFGCDPLNQSALERILKIKERAPSKGLIIVASKLNQIMPFIDMSKISGEIWEKVTCVWPGPITYILPASDKTPKLLRGGRDTIAIRVSSNSTICELCDYLNLAIVSTSSNLSGKDPLREYLKVEEEFGNLVDLVVHENVGEEPTPTEIRDALTGKIIRKGIRKNNG